MNQSLPVAVVAGVHRFGARKLVEELVKNDISVVGLGEYVMELDGQNGFEYGSNLGDVEKVDYVFDFEGKLETWRAAENWGSKLVVIEVNGYEGEDKSWLVSAGVDWRLVRLYGVFGEGMLQEEEKRVGVENLVPILIAAVKNKNLELPEKGSFRLLAEEDAVEVVLRSIFLSGTKGELINIWGAETKCTEIATSLVEVAKMTRKKIIDKELPERELNDKEILENWEKIRWQPKAKFGESVEKTLQYLFRVVDEENRRGKTKDQTHPASAKLSPPSLDKEGKARAGRFEVVVEQNNDQLLITNYELEDKKPKEDIRSKIYDLRIELKTENEDLRSKKYDLRIEPEEEIVEIKPMIIKSPIPERMVEQEIKEQTPLVRQGGRSHRPERYLRPLDKGDRAPGSEVAVTKKNFKWPRIKFNFNFEGKKWGWGLGIVVGTLVLGLVVGVAGQYQMVKDTMKIQGLVKTRKYQEANVLIGKIEKKLRSSEEMAMDLGLVGTTWGRRYLSVLKVWGEGLSLGKDIVSLVQKSEIIADGILKEKELDWNKEFGSLEVAGVAVEEKSGVLQARMMGNWSWMPARWKSQWQDAVELISNSRQTVSKLVQMVEVMPDLIGVGSKRKEYLVLLQNESELRPNGGFIGSYGILSFDGGKLINFDVNDVYETDGQLKGHVEPPVPIKKYLGEGGWFLRDANWSPDFNQSSKDIQWFFEKETGRKIDGVIGINLSMAKAILGVIGEVYVPDFKEKINSRNLYEQAEYYSETKSFPGSTQKASFLGGLAKQLFEEIKNMSPDKRLKMAEAMIDMLDRNEMQLAINDKLVAEKMAKVGWDGGVYRGKCAQARCFADYLYVVEANLGVNKANYFLYRAMEQSVDISNNSISRVLKLNYENTAKSNAWPGGDYKNYLRVYVPETANLAEVSIVNDSGIKTIVGGDDLVVNQVLGKKEIGFLVMVPTGKKRQVEVRYVDSIDLSKSEKFSYLNYIQKQSGFGDTGLVSLVSVPDGWQVIQVEPEASLVKGKALFNQKLLKDIKMGVEISK